MSRLRELLQDGRVHLLDGAMGTMLYSHGVFVNVCYDELNLTEPDLVRDVHAAYVRAGAEIIETNTFGANPIKLSAYGLADRVEEINATATALARAAATDRARVVGAVGPLGIRIEPWGPTGLDEAEAYFGRQISGLVAGEVDGFILETFSDLTEIQTALRAIRRQTDLPVIAQMSVGVDGTTSYGTPVETLARELEAAGADAVGVNCSVGPAAMLDTIERLAETTSLPISAQPNAGLPREVGDRKIYLASPEYMAQYARRMIDAGARLIGGCCGTTPDHVKHMSAYVRSVHPRTSAPQSAAAAPLPSTAPEAVPLAERSAWGALVAGEGELRTVEILPPRGWNPADMVRDATRLAAAGVDAIHLLDSPRGHGRMGALPAALILEREMDVETIVHYTCRDRNMLGMVNDLLGAAGAGLRNVLLVTGEPPVTGPYPDATAVFDIDSIGLTNVVHHLNHGLEPGGSTIGEPTRYVIGVAASQSAVDADREVERFRWKVDAGADFAVTQPVFDPDQLQAFLDRARPDIPVIAGLWAITSLRTAEFLANEVPGVNVPAAIVERMARAQESGAEAARAEGVAIALEIHEAIRSVVRGVQVVAPFGGADRALDLLRALPTR